jgi:cobalt-zinc-cadmium efflux system membrane fusion protein
MRLWGRGSALAATAALAVCLAGCGQTKPAEASASSASDPAVPGQPRLLTVPPGQLAHLQLVPVERTTWLTAVHTTGTVDWNANRTTPAITQVSGPIVRTVAEPGDTVAQDRPLLYVNSPDVSNAVAAYKKARNRQDLARRALARSADLYEHHAIAQKDYESAQADLNDAVTDVQNTLQALRIFGITQAEIDEADRAGSPISSQLAVRAPIAGVVVQKLVAPGQLIQAGATTCYVISDVSTVWVQGHIFDRDLASVRVGDPVEETNPSLPRVFHGTVEYVGAMLDPATRTTPVRIVTRNPGGILKKDMFVDVTIRTRARRNVLAVPTSAVLHNAENEPFVYVEARAGAFAQRLVTVGAEQDGLTEIASGLKEGERVVSEGSVFLQFAGGSQ